MNKANVEISWNGVPAATGTTKTEFDNPFVIGRVDLSRLNSLLGTVQTNSLDWNTKS